MKYLKIFLDFTSAFAAFYILGALWAIAASIYERVRFKKTIKWGGIFSSLNPRSKKVAYFFVTVLALGLINFVLSYFLSSAQIGAFYEKQEYTEYYDAYFYRDKDHPEEYVYGIAKIDRYSEAYYISQVHLPFGRYIELDCEYDPREENKISAGERPQTFFVKLGRVAGQQSFERLKKEIVSIDGEYCASRASDTVHYSNCRYVKGIKLQNVIFFPSFREADMLGFFPCEECFN